MKTSCFIFIAFFIMSCKLTEHKNYKKINSKDINIYLISDSKGVILDTIPTWFKLINNYSIKDVDTSKIIFSNAEIVLDYARLILDHKYGKSKMDSEEPFNIKLIDNQFWLISGTLPEKYSHGGVAEILFSKYDKRILYLGHGK